MQLVVGNLSTWSMRAWLCSRIAEIELDLVVVPLGEPGYEIKLAQYSPSHLVPVLVTDQVTIHDSLAIVEFLNEVSDGALYPAQSTERAMARSLCAELHSGFMTIRELCPFAFDEVVNADQDNPAIRKDIARLQAIFSQASLPFMFDMPGAVDAFYALMAYRLHAYGVVLEGRAGEYQQSLLNWPEFTKVLNESRGWAA